MLILKKCSTCKCSHPLSNFYKDAGKRDGLKSQCKGCVKPWINSREKTLNRLLWDRENPERRRATEIRRQAKSPEKHKARSLANYAKQSGKLVKPKSCESCNEDNPQLEMHHSDYMKPLDVTFLCKRCHAATHVNQ